MRAAVVIGEVDLDTVEEALRAAVGLTLRGARVLVVRHDRGALGPRGARAIALLAEFGHRVAGPEALREAIEHDRVEIWGPVPPAPHAGPVARALTHVVRPGRTAAAVAPGDTVLHLADPLDDVHAADLLDRDPVVLW